MNAAVFAIAVTALLHQKSVRPAKDYPVRIEATADKPATDGTQRIRVKITIQDGYWMFANPTGNENFLSETKLSVAGKDAKVTYPRGQIVKDEVVGDYNVYRGAVTLEAVVKRAAGEGPLEIGVRVRPYDRRGCLWRTKTLKATVP